MGPGDALSPEAEDLYRSAVQRGRLTLDTAADLVASGRADDVIHELLAQGLVEQTGENLRPRPPRLALASIAEAQDRSSDRTRQLAVELGRLWDEHAAPASYVEVLTQDTDVSESHERLLRQARSRVRGLSIGPVGDTSTPAPQEAPQVAPGFEESIASGVSYRIVYGVKILRDPIAFAGVQRCIAAGEEVRVFPDVPITMTLVDDRAAVVIAPGSGEARRHGLVVHRSGLLDQLGDLFEAFWRMAVPIGANNDLVTGAPGPDADSRRLLAYLSAGLTDDSIARELGVSERTVGRRVARLQEVLGAHSRFQLGVQASRQGWL